MPSEVDRDFRHDTMFLNCRCSFAHAAAAIIGLARSCSPFMPSKVVKDFRHDTRSSLGKEESVRPVFKSECGDIRNGGTDREDVRLVRMCRSWQR